MKPVYTLNLLQNLEDRVEASISLAVITFQNLDTAILLKPSVTGGWSIAQCLAHLNSYGDFYLPHIKKAFDATTKQSPNELFKSSWPGNYFTQMMLPCSDKKYHAIKKHLPKEELDSHKVVATFIHQQELLLSYLNIAKTKNLNTIKIPVSILPFIKLKAGDIFQFLIAHNERHLEQAKRNLQ